ncbi:MAG: peptide chain release factor N(5)-glutamine methyltransferase [Solirubrobacteraceae bacterium]
MTGSVASPSTVGAAVAGAAARLAAAGVDSPRLDTEILLAEVLGGGREQVVLRAGEPADPAVLERFQELVDRRAAREPVAYILGRRAFRHLELAVDPRVLIPRPETELLVEVGLALGQGTRVVDVGTGSGAVALALKHERPDLEVTGTEISGDALTVARDNAARLGLEVTFVQADLLDGIELRADAVLANLPYVEEDADLEPEILRYEPVGALFAGPDGLDQIRRLVGTLDDVPLVALEVGSGQAQAVSELLREAGFPSVHRLPDLAGHERVVVGRR